MKQSRALWRTSSYASYFRIPKICDECCRCLLNVSKRQRSFVKFTEIDKVRQKETITEGGGGVLNKVLYGDCFTPRSNFLPFYIPFLTQKRYSLVYILFNNFFMRQHAESLESTQEAYQSFSRRSREQLQLLECSPNQYLDIRTAEACTDCFMTLSKRSMQNLIFQLLQRKLKRVCATLGMPQCLRDYNFVPHSYVFALKLRETLLKSLKITLKKMVKYKLRCQKTDQ